MRWSLATIVLVPRGQRVHADRDERLRVFDWAASVGFEGVEISPQWLDIEGLDDAELRQAGEDVRATGLAVSGININRCILTRTDRADAHFALLQRAIAVAKLLETNTVTLSLSMPLGDNTRPLLRGHEVPLAERQKTAELLQELAEQAQPDEISLSLEMHDDGLLDTAELCLEMAHRFPAKNKGVNPDLGNLIRSSPQADWVAALKHLAPATNNWHVKNYRLSQPAPVWDGDIDYVQAMQIMQMQGYSGWVSIESYFGDVRSLQARSLTNLKQLAGQ